MIEHSITLLKYWREAEKTNRNRCVDVTHFLTGSRSEFKLHATDADRENMMSDHDEAASGRRENRTLMMMLKYLAVKWLLSASGVASKWI